MELNLNVLHSTDYKINKLVRVIVTVVKHARGHSGRARSQIIIIPYRLHGLLYFARKQATPVYDGRHS